jgi:hypothetical protein
MSSHRAAARDASKLLQRHDSHEWAGRVRPQGGPRPMARLVGQEWRRDATSTGHGIQMRQSAVRHKDGCRCGWTPSDQMRHLHGSPRRTALSRAAPETLQDRFVAIGGSAPHDPEIIDSRQEPHTLVTLGEGRRAGRRAGQMAEARRANTRFVPLTFSSRIAIALISTPRALAMRRNRDGDHRGADRCRR